MIIWCDIAGQGPWKSMSRSSIYKLPNERTPRFIETDEVLFCLGVGGQNVTK